jgi:hypothetical protein
MVMETMAKKAERFNAAKHILDKRRIAGPDQEIIEHSDDATGLDRPEQRFDKQLPFFGDFNK